MASSLGVHAAKGHKGRRAQLVSAMRGTRARSWPWRRHPESAGLMEAPGQLSWRRHQVLRNQHSWPLT